MLYDSSEIYMITNGQGEIRDPNDIVFTTKSDAKQYMNRNWDKQSQKEFGLTIQPLSEIIKDCHG